MFAQYDRVAADERERHRQDDAQARDVTVEERAERSLRLMSASDVLDLIENTPAAKQALEDLVCAVAAQAAAAFPLCTAMLRDALLKEQVRRENASARWNGDL